MCTTRRLRRPLTVLTGQCLWARALQSRALFSRLSFTFRLSRGRNVLLSHWPGIDPNPTVFSVTVNVLEAYGSLGFGFFLNFFFLFQLGFFYRVAEDDEGFNKHAVEDPEEIASMVDMWVTLPIYPSLSLSLSNV